MQYKIHSTRYKDLSDDHLYSMYRESNYSKLKEDEKLDLVQETVNRDALERGEIGAPEVRFVDLPVNESGNSIDGIININRDNIISFIKGSLSGNIDAKATGEISKLFDSTIKNTLLTDYIKKAYKDERVKKFVRSGVYAPKNSISLYKMYSSYLTVVPKDQLPIDMEKLNDALLGERGYYGMLLKTEEKPTSVLRFNIHAFKNSYNLADLSKMELVYYGIRVGSCKITELTIDKEFDFQKKNVEVTAESVIYGDVQSHDDELDVYDIVLAGVEA